MAEPKLFIGIDAGITGAVAVLNNAGECITYRTLPHRLVGKRNELDGDTLSAWFREELFVDLEIHHTECETAVEESPPFNQGVVSAYTSGYNNGRLHECLFNVFHQRVTRVNAKKWQRVVYDFKLRREDDKKQISIDEAIKKHGEMNGAFNVKKYAHGISDALHIAEYCRLSHQSPVLSIGK